MSDNTSTTPQDNLVTLEIDGQSVSVPVSYTHLTLPTILLV